MARLFLMDVFAGFGWRRSLEECGRSSGEGPSNRSTPTIIAFNYDEAAFIGGHQQNVARTPAKPPFAGEERLGKNLLFHRILIEGFRR
ncbi:MAG: hypothetical protein WBV27_06225 [Trichococcus sp.]